MIYDNVTIVTANDLAQILIICVKKNLRNIYSHIVNLLS